MPITVRKFNAQVKDPETGEMVPAGLLSSDALGAIESAKSDAVTAVEGKQAVAEAAVELKGQTTLASIPADYTELSNEVDGVKIAIGDVHKTGSEVDVTVTPESGAIKGDVGSALITSSSSSFYRFYINVAPGEIFKITTRQGTSSSYEYYIYTLDSNNLIVSRHLAKPDSNTTATYTLTVPKGVASVAVLCYYSTSYIVVKKVVTEYQTIQDQVDEISDCVDRDYQTAMSIGNALVNVARSSIFAYNKTVRCLNFAYITDTHANDSNKRAEYNLDLFTKLANEKWCDFASHGGDLITVTSETTQASYFNDVGPVLEKLGKIGIPVYISEGNHDVNGKNDDTNAITPQQWYLMTKSMSQMDDFKIDAAYSGYYFKDFDDVKIRVIVLDYYHGHDSETGIENSGIYGAQLQWFGQTALNLSAKSTPTDWAVLILVHNITSNTSAPAWQFLSAFLDGTSYAYATGGYTVDYTGQGQGNVIAIIHGHEHSDSSETIGNVNVIGVTCGYISSTAAISADDFAIDVFSVNPSIKKLYATRIGRGTDREWSY